ncbi:hypothetical protein M3221_23450 [Domibacillus indicus]|uniref:hypothetical protein n=1 Tax=Domibacillus indicus TaxID=1437523 RepID=UPI0020421644|nr:hypothetical protein [Domibacillus indicus]MCM3791294.1 hypothetical protein [Domibacillus indicus]
MKIKNKLFGLAMAGMIGLSSLGTVSAYAATDTTTSTTAVQEETAKNVKATLDAASQEKVQAIMDKLTTGLQDLGVTLPEKGDKADLFTDLDADTKAKTEAIMDKMKADTITFEEAQTQLKELGVTLPDKAERGDRGNLFADLDMDTKAKVEAIMDKEKAGTITLEEAQTQLKELGVTLPDKAERGGKGDLFADLDADTKAKAEAEAIMDKERAGTITFEEAQTQLKELGVTLPDKADKDQDKVADLLAGLDADTKTKAQKLIDQAEEQLAEYGIDHLPLHGFNKATEAE